MIAYFDDLNVTNAEHQKSCFKHYMNATSNNFTYFFQEYVIHGNIAFILRNQNMH